MWVKTRWEARGDMRLEGREGVDDPKMNSFQSKEIIMVCQCNNPFAVPRPFNRPKR